MAEVTPTLLTADSDARRLVLALHWLRSGACRIAADCERMLEALHAPDRRDWRDAVADALIASRHLLVLTNQTPERAPTSRDATQRLASLTSAIQDPQRRILSAMNTLQQFVPVSTEEELLIQDARTVRDVAADLLTLGQQRTVRSADRRRNVLSAQAARDAAVRKARVLVVDDQEMMREMLRRRLGILGYEVLVAENGRRALAIAAEERLDLILTDINMPEMGGMELLRLLKAGEQTRSIPVIVVSGQDDLSSVAACIEAGAEDHITKPYEPILLDARMRACLERKRMRDLELDYLARVAQLTSAAEAVERELYIPGTLAPLASQDDELGRLARVFDRMVSGLKSREDRLQQRIRELRREMGETSDAIRAAGHTTPDSPFTSGETLANRYQVKGHLGSGGMGMVYRARDVELNEDVAIKVVRHDLVRQDPDVIERLKSEIRLARKISHRNVVRTHDLGEWKGTYFITMEFVEGITVAALLDRRGRLTVESTLAIGTQLSEALAVAHDQQIIHRDIKPANLLVDHGGVLKVMDFGIARSIEPDTARQTASGFIVGTPAYMAPEQLMGGTVDTRSDLFAVGIVLYECLAGRPPFVADDPLTLIAHIIDGSFPKLGELVPGVPPRLEAIIHQLLQLHPADRTGTARALATMLTELEHSAVR